MAASNRKWILRTRPQGMPRPEDFELREEPLPAPGENQFLVRNGENLGKQLVRLAEPASVRS